jgi:hypothetical protein
MSPQPDPDWDPTKHGSMIDHATPDDEVETVPGEEYEDA